MFNLIIKDMLLLRKTAVFAVVYMIFLIFAFKEIPQGALYTGIVGSTYILMATSMAYEDKNNSDIVLNSLPLSRSEIVLAKYLQVFLFAIVASAIFVIMSSLLKLFSLDIGVISINLKTIATAIFSVVLMNCLYFPVFYKLGYIKSKYVNFVVFFIFFFSIQTIMGSLVNTESGFVLDVINFFQGFSGNLLALLILLAAVLIAVMSYSLSLSFYRAREF
jgi:ABC-type transport system involved in multi-copper enzyme maturation permease subunit